MPDTTDIVKQLGEIERQISDGEALLRKSGNERIWEWIFFATGILIIFFQENTLFYILGGVLIVASIWRMVTVEKNTKEIEEGLREYKGRRAELQAQLMIRE